MIGIGDRVYYADNGSDDIGTVRNIVASDSTAFTVQVVWDNNSETDYYTPAQLVLVWSNAGRATQVQRPSL